ncbi:hypothetical protein [Microbacterium sp. NPDC056234]|uniref:hypothetical protein n=1 Tax=Microbacterium sp. NPDC056234 TaxID=3345757 RepID=UPI0035DAFDCC
MRSNTTPRPKFATGEGLRALLHRLRAGTPDAWAVDPEARALAEYTMIRYERLCRKWQRDPAEGATAAFLVMRKDYILEADEPWAVVTTAVRSAVIAENQAERLLIDPDRARQEDVTGFERPVRAGDHEEYLYDIVATDTVDEHEESPLLATVERIAVALFTGLGWDEQTATTAIEYVMTRLMVAMDTDRAYRYLRRDYTMPVALDIPAATWRQLVRVLVGTRGSQGAPTRRGLIARIVLELERDATPAEVIAVLLEDDDLVVTVFHSVPGSP